MLKKSMPIILLRNLRPQDGLCNGTRLICKQFHLSVIVAEIITGANAGTTVLIPRIPLTTPETELPFALRRKHFPVCPAFAMSINKSQGKTLDHVVSIYRPRCLRTVNSMLHFREQHPGVMCSFLVPMPNARTSCIKRSCNEKGNKVWWPLFHQFCWLQCG
jgi:hypothetical protein